MSWKVLILRGASGASTGLFGKRVGESAGGDTAGPLHIQVRPHLAVHQHDIGVVARAPVGVAGIVAFAREFQLAVRIEGAILNDERNLELTFRQRRIGPVERGVRITNEICSSRYAR